MRRAHRVDANQGRIVAALRKCGVAVRSLAGIGDGVPDLLAYSARSGYVLLEVKVPGEKLTEDQERFHREWPGRIHIVETIDDALRACGVLG